MTPLQLLVVSLILLYNGWVLAFSPAKYSRRSDVGGSWASQHVVTTTRLHFQATTDVQQDLASTPSRAPKDDFEWVQHFTEMSINFRGQQIGLEALRRLGEQSKKRMPFDFDEDSTSRNPASLIQPFRQMLSPVKTTTFLGHVRELERQGYLSTNPDSVDGLPSLHVNLVSNGRPVVDPMAPLAELDDFQQISRRLLDTIHETIYDELLPQVQLLLNSTSIGISDIFLRRYGQDVCGQVTRQGIGAHYDVFSRVTAVIALDDTAKDGRNGLFTTHLLPTNDGGGATSNHASLRRFFPLASGDGVVHSWDVLHGVDVEEGLDRTSLIVWFAEEQQENAPAETAVSPWLSRHPDLEADNVAQFVLASALESVDEGERNEVMDYTPHDLYLASAAKGNTFALTRMGSLLEDQGEEGLLSIEFLQRAEVLLDQLRPISHLPEPIQQMQGHDLKTSRTCLACRFWYEGAIRGNPLAQRALADELMMVAASNSDEDACKDDYFLLAAILFGLAAQQGVQEATESLVRVVEWEMSTSRDGDNHPSEAAEALFLSCPTAKVAKAALSS